MARLVPQEPFDDTHRAAIGDIVDAANMLQRTSRAGTAGGSDTFKNLATARYLTGDGFGMGALAAMLARVPATSGTTIGSGLGSYLFGVPGAIGGGAVGGALGKMLPYERPQTSVLDLVGPSPRSRMCLLSTAVIFSAAISALDLW